MNERFRELVEQCTKKLTTYSYSRGNVTETYFDKEKFAELIVKECMATILKESKWYWDKEEWESSNTIQNAARRVKEHFGVKE